MEKLTWEQSPRRRGRAGRAGSSSEGRARAHQEGEGGLHPPCVPAATLGVLYPKKGLPLPWLGLACPLANAKLDAPSPSQNKTPRQLRCDFRDWGPGMCAPPPFLLSHVNLLPTPKIPLGNITPPQSPCPSASWLLPQPWPPAASPAQQRLRGKQRPKLPIPPFQPHFTTSGAAFARQKGRKFNNAFNS